LLAGAYNSDFQVGANSGETVNVTIMGTVTATRPGAGYSALDLGVKNGGTTGSGNGLVDLTGLPAQTNAAIMENVDKIDIAINAVSTARAELGATQNQFEHVINNANVALENVTASESRIRDTDMAAEMVNFTKSQILSQAGTAMLAQAKSLPQDVLQLLR
ncbi:MAG: flagellin, partial [Cellulomonas sp.]